ncbi:LacI family transcriptional regulator [Maribrevibacterium harenarium]|uniref:LacI family transcriptional regulator n=1 Tax=Maribrevibacterium harenarium TaxID=2589817 RepID=A0A501WZV6_9GAMM|nr:LacI family DNA-binding transcriptional regulator [Maribrevibacterium harenarium]TPE54064.1 LacI family transcriptional regulator [Maribrevibacterium harenarium]
MSRRPTIHDLAAAAGVSTATVDRVLNRRSKVREATAQRVLIAAEDIGYHAAGLLRKRVQEAQPVKHITVLLQRSNDEFYRALGETIELACSRQTNFQFETSIVFMEEVSPNHIVDCLNRAGKQADGVALVALDDLLINQEVEALLSNKVPVISLLSPLSSAKITSHIGLDGRKVGRTGAWAINRLTAGRSGKIGIMLGSHRYLNQEIAEISFISYFRDFKHQFEILDARTNLDDVALAKQATLELLHDYPDLVAIYSAGGGVDGIIDALKETGRHKDIVLICNELTTKTRKALIDGTVDLVLATPIQKIASELAETFAKAFDSKRSSSLTHIRLPAEIYVAEGL